MRALSEWGRNGKGYYYGLKLHLVTDLEGRLLGFCFTPGNTDDRKPVKKLVAGMPGIFIADAGYIGQELADDVHVEGSRIFMARAKRNMKKLMSSIQQKLYNTRMLIKLNFRNLKMFHNLVTSLPRSIDGYLANYIYSILSYVLR
jgi:IS5 family transposase